MCGCVCAVCFVPVCVRVTGTCYTLTALCDEEASRAVDDVKTEGFVGPGF